MTYALYVLAKRPSLWSDCLQEVLSVCGDSPPTPSDLSQLPVLDAVLHETLRFFSPVPLISRQVHSATSIGSSKQKRIELPVGALVQVHICIISRLKEYWGPTAGEFDHTRWLKAKKPYTHSYAFLPFGAGPRNCTPAANDTGTEDAPPRLTALTFTASHASSLLCCCRHRAVICADGGADHAGVHPAALPHRASAGAESGP